MWFISPVELAGSNMSRGAELPQKLMAPPLLALRGSGGMFGPGFSYLLINVACAQVSLCCETELS